MTIKELVKEMFKNIKSNWFMPVTEHQVYSEQEAVVGVWTDGKPIYRRTIFLTITSAKTYVDTGIVLDDFERLVFIQANVDDYIGYSLTHDQVVSVRVRNSDNAVVYYAYETTTNNKTMSVIIEYTKTTDSPETTKVPFEPLIEYSTDEKMIGYWIDGKPIYRKTFCPDKFYGTGLSTVIAGFVSLYSIDNMVNLYGYGKTSSGAMYKVDEIGGSASYFAIEGNGDLKLELKNTGATWKICFTAEYTKTTD